VKKKTRHQYVAGLACVLEALKHGSSLALIFNSLARQKWRRQSQSGTAYAHHFALAYDRTASGKLSTSIKQTVLPRLSTPGDASCSVEISGGGTILGVSECSN